MPDELKNFAKNTNTAKTTLDIVADPDSTITVDHNDRTVNGLVEYSSQGGGDVSFKIRGLKKRLHTKNAKKQVTIEEILIEEIQMKGHSGDVISAIKDIIDL